MDLERCKGLNNVPHQKNHTLLFPKPVLAAYSEIKCGKRHQTLIMGSVCEVLEDEQVSKREETKINM